MNISATEFLQVRFWPSTLKPQRLQVSSRRWTPPALHLFLGWTTAAAVSHSSLSEGGRFVSRSLPTKPIESGTCQLTAVRRGFLRHRLNPPRGPAADGRVDLSASCREVRSIHFSMVKDFFFFISRNKTFMKGRERPVDGGLDPVCAEFRVLKVKIDIYIRFEPFQGKQNLDVFFFLLCFALFLSVRHSFTESDSIVKTRPELPALITPRLVINCQMSSCCTGIPSRTSKTRDERAATASWGSLHPKGVYGPRFRLVQALQSRWPSY